MYVCMCVKRFIGKLQHTQLGIILEDPGLAQHRNRRSNGAKHDLVDETGGRQNHARPVGRLLTTQPTPEALFGKKHLNGIYIYATLSQ